MSVYKYFNKRNFHDTKNSRNLLDKLEFISKIQRFMFFLSLSTTHTSTNQAFIGGGFSINTSSLCWIHAGCLKKQTEQWPLLRRFLAPSIHEIASGNSRMLSSHISPDPLHLSTLLVETLE